MLAERIERWKREDREQAIQEGLKQGIEQGLEQGIEQGIEQGLEQGIERGKAQALSRLLERRFGSEAAQVHRRRIEQADAETLDRWFDRAITAPDVDTVFG